MKSVDTEIDIYHFVAPTSIEFTFHFLFHLNIENTAQSSNINLLNIHFMVFW